MSPLDRAELAVRDAEQEAVLVLGGLAGRVHRALRFLPPEVAADLAREVERARAALAAIREARADLGRVVVVVATQASDFMSAAAEQEEQEREQLHAPTRATCAICAAAPAVMEVQARRHPRDYSPPWVPACRACGEAVYRGEG